MRLVTWNCRVGGFRNKAKYIAPLRPDVLAVQEVEPLDRVQEFAGSEQPTFRDRLSNPRFPRRSIGVFSYTGTTLQAADLVDPVYEFRRYRATHGGLAFQVVAVWTAPAEIRANNYKQAIHGARLHQEWIRRTPTVIMGDFNDNASYRSTNWPELMSAMEPLGLVSAYHSFFGEEFGSESRPTHFHKGSTDSAWHLDYCFIPQAWETRITHMEVGDHSEWSHVSDHVPLVVDLDLDGVGL